MFLLGFGTSTERKLFAAVEKGDLNRVKRLLAKRVRLDAIDYVVYLDVIKRFSFALPPEVAAWKQGAKTVRRIAFKFGQPKDCAIFSLTPTELAAKIEKSTGRSMTAIIETLVAYGFPPPHQCDLKPRDPNTLCELVCKCGASEIRHNFRRVSNCLERCTNCCVEKGQHVSSRVRLTTQAQGGPYMEVCSYCHEVLAHSALAGIPAERVHSLEYVSQDDCTMKDTETGLLFLGVHPAVWETSEYDYDYCKTHYWLVCLRCDRQIAFRSPGFDYNGKFNSSGNAWDRWYEQPAVDSDHIDDEISRLVAVGDKIRAMKLYREQRAWAGKPVSLQEAKQFVEKISAKSTR